MLFKSSGVFVITKIIQAKEKIIILVYYNFRSENQRVITKIHGKLNITMMRIQSMRKIGMFT